MCVNTLSFTVVMGERTPLSFEVVRIKLAHLSKTICPSLQLLIRQQFVDQRRLDILLSVRKRTKFSILAFGEGQGTEFELVPVRVVQVLCIVVSFVADLVSAVLAALAQFLVVECYSAPVEQAVIEETLFWVVRVHVRTRMHFEVFQVQVLYVGVALEEFEHLRGICDWLKLSNVLTLRLICICREHGR